MTVRVVVTGMGLVCPIGVGIEFAWNKLLSGGSGISGFTEERFKGIPCQVAGYVPRGESPGQLNIDKKFSRSDIKNMSLATIYALEAAEQALLDAKWMPTKPDDLEKTGVAVGMGMVDIDEIFQNGTDLVTKGYSRISPFFVPKILTNMAAGHISIKYGFQGPNHVVSTACTTGVHAVGDAFNFIRNGDADVMVCGGTEAVVTPLAIAGFGRMRALSTNFNNSPSMSSRPFDKDRDGFVMAEGSGILVLERLDHALARNAKMYAEVLGYGLSGDANHITSPKEDGKGALRCMKAAIEKSKVTLSDVGYVNAHATSTPIGDAIEVKAIKDLFGDHAYKLAVSSTKGATGHLLGAAGAVEAIFTAMACHTGLIPPTLNLNEPSQGLDLNFVARESQKWSEHFVRRVALTNSFGFGGTNASVVVSSIE